MYCDDDYVDIDGRDANGNQVAGYGIREDSDYSNYSSPSYQYEFYNLEALVTSKVFQQQLTMALSNKQKEIDSLREELFKYFEADYDSNG